MVDPVSASNAGAIRSHLSKKWLVRMVLIAVGLFAFGMWGLYDATIAYPRRGAAAASFAEFNYLTQLSPGSTGSIDNPTTELERLVTASEKGPKRDWLEQLAYIGRLDPAHTKLPRTDAASGQSIPDVLSRLESLSKDWTRSDGGQKKAPKPLSVWDIPTQWLIMAIGVGLSLWMFTLVVIARGKTYTWIASERRLGLPNGASLVPADIAEFDKRKWHKFFIHLNVKPEHPSLGGKEVALDLMRYEPVEEWVLEMERAANPAPAEEPPAADPADAPPAA